MRSTSWAGDSTRRLNLEIEDLIDLAALLLGDRRPLRDVDLLGSAAARPRTTVLGEDAYPFGVDARAFEHAAIT